MAKEPSKLLFKEILLVIIAFLAVVLVVLYIMCKGQPQPHVDQVKKEHLVILEVKTVENLFNEMKKALSRLADAASKLEAAGKRFQESSTLSEFSKEAGKAILDSRLAQVNVMMARIRDLEEKLNSKADDTKQSELEAQVRDGLAQIDKFTKDEVAFEQKLQETLVGIQDWQKEHPPDSGKPSGDGEKKKEDLGNKLGDLLQMPVNLAKKVIELPLQILQAVLGPLGDLFGLGGTEYREELTNVATKILSGQPVLEEDLTKLLETLKNDKAAQAASIASFQKLADQLEKVPRTNEAAAEFRTLLGNLRKDLQNQFPDQVRTMMTYLDSMKPDGLEKVTAVDLRSKVLNSDGQFASQTVKESTRAALRLYSDDVYNRCWLGSSGRNGLFSVNVAGTSSSKKGG